MTLEKVSVSFIPAEAESEALKMDAEGSQAEGAAVARAIRKSGLNGGYVEDRSPEALAMEGEGPGSIIEQTLVRRASVAVTGLAVEWRVDRISAAIAGRGVLNGAISRAKIGARDLAEQHGPRIPGVNGNGKA